MALLDMSHRPENQAELLRKTAKKFTVETNSLKLDQVADWKAWVQALGVRLLGLRLFAISFNNM